MNEVIIECSDIVKIYQSKMNPRIKTSALKGIDIKISKGDLITIFGPSGSGKSTLLNILGLIDFQSSGEVLYHRDGKKIKYSDLNRSVRISIRQNDFGFLFQIPQYNLFSNLSVKENIKFPMKIVNTLSNKEQEERAIELLKIFEIENKKNQGVFNLSGGEAQRVALCVALANDPDILFLDEPTGELDVQNKKKLMEYIMQINRDFKKTIVIVSHEIRFLELSSRILYLKNGKISHEPLYRSEYLSVSANSVIISNIGEIQIPKNYLEAVGIYEYVNIKQKEGKILIKPFEKSLSRETEIDVVYVKEDGKIILPKTIIQEIGSNFLSIELKENSLILTPNNE